MALSRRRRIVEAATQRISLPERKVSPGRDILLRVLIALSVVVVTALVVYWEGDCYAKLGVKGDITLIDAFYYATVTLSTTGYGDIVPVCESSRIVNVLVITPLRFLFLIVLIGTTVEALTQRTRRQLQTNRWRKKVKDHCVIIGFGVKGRTAAKTLITSGMNPADIIVVTPDATEISEANTRGLVAVLGDGRREEVLMEAAIDQAKRVVVATDQDDTSILVTLTARRLSPAADIVAAVRESQNANILKQSGATTVIPTAESAGHLMGMSLVSKTAGELMEDLLDPGHGLEVIERPITREELGKSPESLDTVGQIVLAVIRDGIAHRFDSGDIKTLIAGDHLVVINHTNND